ncbi:hypothetical protein HK097_002902 [Rhizophlyctis rosea]|uniref:Uncharacterized protein n=1 Tax=Rhizophlyctis rosea TaxID=64517 RepID=A0AAD5S302_9FUNG|nr:hypothetical protein HK097_002902 [Rhizophlyctis rosea]
MSLTATDQSPASPEPTHVLPDPVLRTLARISHPQTARNLICTCRTYHQAILPSDLLESEFSHRYLSSTRRCFLWAVQYGQISHLRRILLYGVAGKKDSIVLKGIQYAVMANRSDVVQYLLGVADHPVIPRGKTDTMPDIVGLVTAAGRGYIDLIRMILKGVTIGYKTAYLPLRAAAENGHLEIVKILVEHDVDLDLERKVPDGFHGAVQKGQLEVLHYLLSLGVHTQGRLERYALEANAFNQPGSLRVLLEGGATLPLDLREEAMTDAVLKGHPECLRVLFEYLEYEVEWVDKLLHRCEPGGYGAGWEDWLEAAEKCPEVADVLAMYVEAHRSK